MLLNTRIIAYFLALLVPLISHCGRKGATSEETPSGKDLFEKPHSDGNTFSCLSCHALAEPAADGIRRAGHTLGDAFSRPHFKNAKLATLRDAVNSCRTEWMAAPAWAEADPRWLALRTFLSEQDSKKTSAALSFEIVEPPLNLTRGNAERGKEAYHKTCVICHGTDARGTSAGPSLAGTQLTAEKIAERIRLSGRASNPIYEKLTGGRMPFWAKDRLSDTELIDIIAYLAMTEASADDIKNTVSQENVVDLSVPAAQTNCASTHRFVGKTVELSRKHHNLSGSVTVVDNCTLRFDKLTYDGGGIDVRVYAGRNGDYVKGFAISNNFFRTAFAKGTAVVHLPPGVSLDDFNGVSVWCLAVGISFGDAQFE